MVFAVIGAMGFQNASRRDNAHSFVTNRLLVENMWGPVGVEDAPGFKIGDTHPSIFCTFRFIDQTARDTFWTDLLTALTGVNGPVAGGWIQKHDCFHDEDPPQPCVQGARVAF